MMSFIQSFRFCTTLKTLKASLLLQGLIESYGEEGMKLLARQQN